MPVWFNPSSSDNLAQRGQAFRPQTFLKVYCDYYNRVISVMEGKLKKEELLKIIGQMEVIEKLPKQLL